jgi:hypothetical protein
MIEQVLADVKRILGETPTGFLPDHVAGYEDLLKKADYIETVLFEGAEDVAEMLEKL